MNGCTRIAIATLLLIGCVAAAQTPTPEAPVRLGSAVSLPAARAAATAAAAQKTSVADGLKLEVWAPPGLVANPVTLEFDSKGRAFVVASERSGLLLDVRQHSDWVPEVHRLTSTGQLRAFFRRVMAPELSDQNKWMPDYNEDGSHDYRDLMVVPERVFRVEDMDHDGVADKSTVVHEGFNDDIASDIAGGILVHGDELYVTAAPDLWRLSDRDKDGLFETKTSISHGYSVHPAFAGHDMSALAQGPDGRIYWKIGDIGLNVTDQSGKRWVVPNNGAVLRSEPDGSNFEVFAWGLRNTQEITFDKFGNMVSVDNDGDHQGETERVVYIVQGSDAGWRSTWQYGKYTDRKNNGYNVWMDENLFRPRWEGQAAYITPPVAPHHSGPSGVEYNPGTALGPEWRDHFFVTSFTGGAANASVYSFELVPDGAGFRMANDRQIVRGLLASGSTFGPDGALYLTDWVRGYEATGEGLVWKLDVPGEADSDIRREVRRLIGTDFRDLPRGELVSLLAHADMRIRQKAQFALVARGEDSILRRIATGKADQLARIHAIRGLGQLARKDLRQASTIRGLLDDADPEIRAQAAKMLGDARDPKSEQELIAALSDNSPRVRFFATEALGRIGARGAITPIVRMLAENNDRDVYLRTAGVHALASIGDGAAIAALARHDSSAVRLAAVVALRRLRNPAVGTFISDADPLVATEAARAINDEGGIVAALPALAGRLNDSLRSEPFLRRAISANLRVGDSAAAQRIARFAADGSQTEPMRLEAVAALGVWPAPSTLDRVDGAWIGQRANRDTEGARAAAASLLTLLDAPGTSSAMKSAVLASATALNAPDAAAYAQRRLQADSDVSVRVAALTALRSLDTAQYDQVMRVALADSNAQVRMAAIRAIPSMKIAPAVAVDELMRVATSDQLSDEERQTALASVGAIKSPEAASALAGLVEQVRDGAIRPALQLDVMEAAAAQGSTALLDQLETAGVGRKLERLADTLPAALEQGGSAARGRQTAQRHPAAQCVRCHIIGTGEATVGPNLNGVGARLGRPELLESLLKPSARIAEGFGQNGVSAMPPMGLLLTPREIRDVVEFLANEK